MPPKENTVKTRNLSCPQYRKSYHIVKVAVKKK